MTFETTTRFYCDLCSVEIEREHDKAKVPIKTKRESGYVVAIGRFEDDARHATVSFADLCPACNKKFLEAVKRLEDSFHQDPPKQVEWEEILAASGEIGTYIQVPNEDVGTFEDMYGKPVLITVEEIKQ